MLFKASTLIVSITVAKVDMISEFHVNVLLAEDDRIDLGEELMKDEDLMADVCGALEDAVTPLDSAILSEEFGYNDNTTEPRTQKKKPVRGWAGKKWEKESKIFREKFGKRRGEL